MDKLYLYDLNPKRYLNLMTLGLAGGLGRSDRFHERNPEGNPS